MSNQTLKWKLLWIGIALMVLGVYGITDVFAVFSWQHYASGPWVTVEIYAGVIAALVGLAIAIGVWVTIDE